jgi:UDP-arabinose 4-epimerase
MRPAVLVTGGAGYIGSHVCKALAHAGYLPVAYDSLVHGHRWAVRWGPLEEGDVADGARLDEVMRRYRPTAVMHFAAFIAAGESVVEPEKYYRNNVGGLLGLLAGMRRAEVARIVFSSTAAIFGTPQRIPIDEEHPKSPINPYGTSKLTCELVLRDYAAAYGIQSIALRYFNAAGADPDGEIGEAHDPETHLIPIVLEAAAGLRPDVAVFGGNYETRDGTCMRDYIHVADLADAHLLAMRRLDTAPAMESYNLGNGQGFTVHEVIEAARRVTGRRIPASVQDPRPGDPAILLADPRRAIRELGWRPRYGALETQMLHAWRWLDGRPRQAARGA